MHKWLIAIFLLLILGIGMIGLFQNEESHGELTPEDYTDNLK